MVAFFPTGSWLVVLMPCGGEEGGGERMYYRFPVGVWESVVVADGAEESFEQDECIFYKLWRVASTHITRRHGRPVSYHHRKPRRPFRVRWVSGYEVAICHLGNGLVLLQLADDGSARTTNPEEKRKDKIISRIL